MAWRVASSEQQLLKEINARAPRRSKRSDGSIGDAAHSARTSDHNPCACHRTVCARDFTHDPGGGFDAHAFADWLRSRCRNGQEKRVKYIISNGRIASTTNNFSWRNYTGSNPHRAHVHVSVAHPQGLFDNAAPWGWGAAAPKPQPPSGGDSLSAAEVAAIKAHVTAEFKKDRTWHAAFARQMDAADDAKIVYLKDDTVPGTHAYLFFPEAGMANHLTEAALQTSIYLKTPQQNTPASPLGPNFFEGMTILDGPLAAEDD